MLPAQPPTSGVRSRKGGAPPGGGGGSAVASGSSSPRLSVEPDVTRPSLRGRVANDVLAAAGTWRRAASGDGQDGYVLSADLKGKGKASEGRRAASEAAPANELGKEREVIVHRLAKTDSIASVSLQYGITPQNLRTSNRLWSSDTIHLRSELLIPLDLCNLPSSSFGVERIAREENGDLTVWQRSADNEGAGGGKGALGTAAERAEKETEVLSPRARRLASASAFGFGGGESGAPTPPAVPQSEFLDVWSNSPSLPSTSPRVSLDLPVPSRSAYLATTNNFFSTSPSPPPPSTEELVSRTVSPPSSSTSQSRPSSSAATSPPPSATALDSTGEGRLEKRTLRVERRAASELAFFPAPASEPKKPASATSSATSTQAVGGDESLFFGPLTTSLTSSFSALGLDKYLTLPRSFPASDGGIRLPSTPSPGGRTPMRKRSGWGLLNFGAEEEEAAAGGDGAGAQGYFGLPSSASVGSVLGLTETGTWSRSRGASEGGLEAARGKPLPPHPPLSPGGSPKPQRHPRGAKVRDSNERVYGDGEGKQGGARAAVRGLFE
ncbi:hypothetical protein JCM10213v2_004753 [Rhodosporidiobolus nylandii]